MNKNCTDLLARLSRTFWLPQRLTWELRAILEGRILGSVLRPSQPGTIAMFHIGRSGSTVLADLLAQHQKKIYWDGEVYERLFRSCEKKNGGLMASHLSVDPIKLLQKRRHRAGRRFYGFELKFFHLKLVNRDLADYVEDLHRLGITHFIILERRNYLRKIISSIVADQRKRYHQPYYKKIRLTRIKLDVNNVRIDRDAKPLIAYLNDYHESFRALEKLLGDRRILPLSYEDDISSDPLIGFQRICDFLDIDKRQAVVRYSKTNPFKLTEIVSNFEEVESTLRRTPFEWMLYD